MKQRREMKMKMAIKMKDMKEEKKKMNLQVQKLLTKLEEQQQQQLLLPERLHLPPPMNQWVALPNQLAEEKEKDEVPFMYRCPLILMTVRKIQTNQKENERSHAAAWKSFSTS